MFVWLIIITFNIGTDDGSGDGVLYSEECLTDISNCSEYATCVETDHGFDCICVDSYEGDGYHCTGLHIRM